MFPDEQWAEIQRVWAISDSEVLKEAEAYPAIGRLRDILNGKECYSQYSRGFVGALQDAEQAFRHAKRAIIKRTESDSWRLLRLKQRIAAAVLEFEEHSHQRVESIDATNRTGASVEVTVRSNPVPQPDSESSEPTEIPRK